MLSDLAAEYEARARVGEVVIAAKERRKGGAENCPPLVQKTAPYPVQKTAPKHCEGNSVKERVFRVGTISDESEHGAHAFRCSSEEADSSSSGIHPDDMFAIRMLGIQEDYAFVAVLDRELKNGRLFGRQIADNIYDRLEAIRDTDDATNGDPVAGRAYRLFEIDFYREEAA